MEHWETFQKDNYLFYINNLNIFSTNYHLKLCFSNLLTNETYFTNPLKHCCVDEPLSQFFFFSEGSVRPTDRRQV